MRNAEGKTFLFELTKVRIIERLLYYRGFFYFLVAFRIKLKPRFVDL